MALGRLSPDTAPSQQGERCISYNVGHSPVSLTYVLCQKSCWYFVTFWLWYHKSTDYPKPDRTQCCIISERRTPPHKPT